MGGPAEILLATGRERPCLWEDDLPLLDAFGRIGLHAAPAVWDDDDVDWSTARAVILRSVFDYVARREQFLDWTERVEAVTLLHNPARLVRWNSHKSYLRDLEAAGVPIVETVWLDAGPTLDIGELIAERGWIDAVIKPAVGNGARGAIRATPATMREAQDHVDALLPAGDLMIQPYIAATEDHGEHALIHIGGRFSHAIAKDQMLAGRPFSLDRAPRVEPDPRELEVAAGILAAIPESPLLYARVDTIVDGDVVRLMELEVIEPVLFLTKAPGAADALAGTVARAIDRTPG